MAFGRILRRFRRGRIIATLVLASLCAVTVVLDDDLSPDLYFLHWGPFENVSCHYSDVRDELPSSEDGFLPSEHSIYFHETSCKGILTARQACAVESASRAHPDWSIYVFFSAPVAREDLGRGVLAVVRQLPNVKLVRVHLPKYAQGTPLSAMVAGGALNRTRWRISHTSDVLRYLTLFKWPGVYLDLDVVVTKSLGSLARNWAARESDNAVAAGALSFSKDEVGRRIADAAISDIKRNYRGDIWGHNGPGVVTRVLKKMCSTSDPSAMSTFTCDGFEVYGPQYFYPVHWTQWRVYVDPGELNAPEAYIHHVWNRNSEGRRVHKHSPYAKLANKYCPAVYKYAGDNF